ncbi:hypothetical protein O181_119906 [Austropuccinia psidii MF-1]|uniref:Uncharacterized protein n=1 Tax=Austropuccinia psidii MF-1 TaxID=1389203 RepID=A0A9Q3Q043_9BASI|nr:hypothetical protein [Austropuccinia psidii MF-1]
MLTRPHRPPNETPTLPAHLHPHHSIRFHTPALTIFMLTWCTPDSTYPYARGVPSRHAPNTTYPYACVVPSQHAPDTTYACEVPSRMLPHHLSLLSRSASRHAPDTTYACVVPSRHAPDTTYAHREPPDMLATPLFLTLVEWLPTCSRHDLSLRFHTTSIGYGGLLAYTMHAITKICWWPSLPTGPKGKLVSIFTMFWLCFKS